LLPKSGEMRYNWTVVRLDAWRMVVPKKVFNAYDGRRTEQAT
jgi:hypothetical protein